MARKYSAKKKGMPRPDNDDYHTGNAGVDGFTRVSRRPRGAGPMDWMLEDEAEEYEALQQELDAIFGGKRPGQRWETEYD